MTTVDKVFLVIRLLCSVATVVFLVATLRDLTKILPPRGRK